MISIKHTAQRTLFTLHNIALEHLLIKYQSAYNTYNRQQITDNTKRRRHIKMIIRNVVNKEAEIKLLLKMLCYDNPRSCTKESISGFNQNQRVIVVRGDCFQYYNKPSKFKDGDMSTLSQKNLKSTVNLSDVYELAFLPENKAQKKSIMLSIPINRISASNIKLYRQKVQSMVKQKQKQDNYIITWLFSFEYDVKAQIFKKIDNEQREKKEKEGKLIKLDPQSDLADSILNVSKNNIENKPEVDPVQDLHKNIEKLREIREEIQFQDKIQRQEQERLKAIKLSMSLRKKEKGDDNKQENQEQEQQQIYPIRNVWPEFWKVYEKTSENIGKPITKQTLTKQLSLLNQMYKIESNVRSLATEYINFKLVGWAPDKVTFQDFQFYKGIWIKLGGKQLNQQFLSNYYLSDLMYTVKIYKKMKFRIPPLFFINYKSIKAICMIDQPFSTIKALEKQIYNVKAPKTKVDLELMSKIKVGLQFFQRILNVKSQSYINGTFQTNAPLGHDVKVFEYDNKYQESSTNFLDSFYYVIGVKGLFPVDYEYQLKKYQPEYCLRPQLIAEYRDYMESVYREDNQLLTQAFMHSEIGLDIKGREDAKVAQVSQQYIPLKIKKLMHEFNQINLIMVDSYSIKSYMSQMGINARYLGQMYEYTQIPYIQQTLQIQMLGRTIKSIYCQSTRDLVTNQQFFKRQMYMKKHKQLLQSNMKYHHDLMINNAIDFLNLVFGVGKQTHSFWKIVIDKCKNKYGHQFTYPLKVKPGCLLHSVLWHCGFIITFDLDVKLFQVQRPFNVGNWNDFRLECKSFDYPSLEINKMIKKMSYVDYLKQSEEMKNVIFSFLKLELLRNNHLGGLGLKTQITLARINNMSPLFQKPLRQCSFHPAQLPYYFINKSPQNFKKALDIINFSLASSHPLFISLYDEYSQQFEPELLKKSTLLAAIKGLGQFHPRTTQLYSKYYRQGFEEFEIKAKRSSDMEAALTICQQLFGKRKYESCLNFCYSRIEKRQKQKSGSTGNDLNIYTEILKYGLMSAVNTRFFEKGLQIAQQFSQMMNTYKIQNMKDHQILLRNTLIIKMNLTSQKFYLYKMVLLVCKIQSQHQPNAPKDQQMFILPHSAQDRIKILHGIINEYYLHQTHSKWIEYIFKCLKRGYIYFNYLNDLFNNYKYHIKNYGMIDFEAALGYLDVLVRFFGQRIFYDNLYHVNQ